MSLFFIRLFIAVCLYISLVTYNEQSLIANTILAVGYRFFLVFSPLFEKTFKAHALNISLLYLLLGALLGFFNYMIPSTLLVAIGLSISGFLIKKKTAESLSLAGLNKIALCIGNIIAGIFLFIVNNAPVFCSCLIIGLALITIMLSSNYTQNVYEPSKLQHQVPTFKNFYKISTPINLAWLCIGMAIGIRIFGLYSIFPSYLISVYGILPKWYGSIITFYGVLVIIFQLPAVLKKFHPSLQTSITVLGLSCIVIGIPNLLRIEYVFGAVIGIFLLAVEEIFAPYIDFYSAKENKIYIKEVSISIGGGMCSNNKVFQ